MNAEKTVSAKSRCHSREGGNPVLLRRVFMESVLAELPSGRKKRGLPPLPELFPIPSPEELHNMIASFAGRSTGSRLAELPPWAGASFVPNLPSQSNVATLPSQPPSFLGQLGRQPESQAKHPSDQSTGTASFTPLDAQSAEAFGPRWQNSEGVSATAFDPLTGSTLLAAAKHTATDAGGKKIMPQQSDVDRPKTYAEHDFKKLASRYNDYKIYFKQISNATGVPEDLLIAFAIMESDLKPFKDGGGIMQVKQRTRDSLSAKNFFEKAIKNELDIKKIDDSLYYGALYIKNIAKNANIDLINKKPEEIIEQIYLRYFMGETGAKNFINLNSSDLIQQNFSLTKKHGLSDETIKNNKKYFLENGKIATKEKALKRLQNRFLPALKVAQEIIYH